MAEGITNAVKTLGGMLKDAGIPYEMKFRMGGWQIGYPVIDHEKRKLSAICNPFSFGYAQNLIEIMGLLTPDEEEFDSVVGYLTPEEVFNRIKADWDAQNGGRR